MLFSSILLHSCTTWLSQQTYLLHEFIQIKIYGRKTVSIFSITWAWQAHMLIWKWTSEHETSIKTFWLSLTDLSKKVIYLKCHKFVITHHTSLDTRASTVITPLWYVPKFLYAYLHMNTSITTAYRHFSEEKKRRFYSTYTCGYRQMRYARKHTDSTTIAFGFDYTYMISTQLTLHIANSCSSIDLSVTNIYPIHATPWNYVQSHWQTHAHVLPFHLHLVHVHTSHTCATFDTRTCHYWDTRGLAKTATFTSLLHIQTFRPCTIQEVYVGVQNHIHTFMITPNIHIS